MSLGEEWMNTVSSQKLLRVRKYKEKTNTVEEYNNWNKNTPELINSRLDDTEEQMIKPEDTAGEITQAETEKKKEWKPWGRFRRPLEQQRAY